MKTLITANIDDGQLHRLTNDLGLDIDYHPIAERDGRYSTERMKELLDGVEILVVGFEGVSAEVMDAASDLRLIACPRGGPDANVDIAAATERDIPVLYAPGRNAVSVADFTLGLILGVARHIPAGHHKLHVGEYTGRPKADSAGGGEREDVTWGIAKGSPYVELKGPELEGETVGVVGLGAIGQLVAERAAGFGVDLVGFDPFVDAEQMAEYGVEKVDLETLCERSRFVTVHCPVTDATRGLIGEDEFSLMSESTYFVNTARGAIIDQDALLAALQAGELAGAALDVYDEEPLPEDHALLDLDNVVTTPHLAGAATGVVSRHSKMVTDDIAAFLDDREPTHVANESVLQTAQQVGGD
ncbi:hydroxyacid dehydrogenase [Salinigranum rubrum]|uniref:Hydroxyacid dehydrogenase n=1 Tax=Salinigranum rubrum TaxID=755307 RepID=A0A2I8VG23_9EURY|nr:2-hydroxyacid dehydrogenase [Salinigranum rubrum]AUV80834.1 hydroxyacid dehydrogenase [Salinigranum rubrum]